MNLVSDLPSPKKAAPNPFNSSPMEEENKLPIYVQVMPIVSRVVEGLIRRGIIQESERKVLIASFLESDSTLNPQGITERCQKIVQKIYPSAHPCELNNFPEAVEGAIESQIEVLTRQIAALRIDSLNVSSDELFPLKTGDSLANKHPSNALEVLSLLNRFIKTSPFWSKRVSHCLSRFLLTFFNEFRWFDDFDKIADSSKLSAYLDGLAKEARELEFDAVRFGEILTLIIFNYVEKIYQDSKEEIAFLTNLDRLAVLAEKCLHANLHCYKDDPVLIKRLRIFYSSRGLPPFIVQYAETILHFMDANFVAKDSLKIELAQGTLRVLKVAEEAALCGQSEFFKELEQSLFLRDGKILPLPKVPYPLFERFLKILMENAPQEDCTFKEWTSVFELVVLYLFNDPSFLFVALHQNMIDSSPQGLADFLTEQRTIELKLNQDSEMKGLWVEHRDRVVSLFLAEKLQQRQKVAEKENKKATVSDFFSAIQAFEMHCRPNQDWMKINTIHIHCPLFAGMMDDMAKLNKLYKVVFSDSIPAPKGKFFDKLPRLKSLVLSNGWRMERLEASAELHFLTLPVKVLNFLSNWRALLALYPNLRELVLLENPSGTDEECFDEPDFTEKDVALYPNLEIYRGTRKIFNGSSRDKAQVK